MTEADARTWLEARGWATGQTGDRLAAFVRMLLEESERQNLISATTRNHVWTRHIIDSAQLLPLIVGRDGLWIDLGTGAGLPGIVIACLRDAPILMIEARPLRTAFLQRCIDELGLTHASVITGKIERVTAGPAAIVSARAYAPLDRLLASAVHLTDSSTTWLLPKGRNAENELAIARRDWQAAFHVEQSVTDVDSAIVTVTGLTKREIRPVAAVAPRTYRRSARPMRDRS